MSRLVESLTVFQYADTGDQRSLVELLETIVGDVEALKEGLQNVREVVAMWGPQASGTPPLSRAEALKTAHDHVEAMSTKANGYQDAKLSDKIQAVDRLARFLMGETA